jgi:hypothetical protein
VPAFDSLGCAVSTIEARRRFSPELEPPDLSVKTNTDVLGGQYIVKYKRLTNSYAEGGGYYICVLGRDNPTKSVRYSPRETDPVG